MRHTAESQMQLLRIHADDHLSINMRLISQYRVDLTSKKEKNYNHYKFYLQIFAEAVTL